GARHQTYQLDDDDAGAAIAVRYTGTKVGYRPGEIVSPAVMVAGGGALRATSPPTISGTPRAGATLSVDPGAWNGTGLTFSYQWKVIGYDIPSATGTTYVVPPVLSGYPVTVEV